MNITKIKTVSAVFPCEKLGSGHSPAYTYFVPEGDEPKIGDMIVTSVNWGSIEGVDDFDLPEDDEDECRLTRTKLRRVADSAKIARVISVNNTPDPSAKKFYLKLITSAELSDSHSRNLAFLRRYADAEDAMNKLEELLRKQNRVDAFEKLASSNPQAAELLAKIKDI